MQWKKNRNKTKNNQLKQLQERESLQKRREENKEESKMLSCLLLSEMAWMVSSGGWSVSKERRKEIIETNLMKLYGHWQEPQAPTARERERERVITPLQWWKKTGNDGHLYKSGFPHGFP